MSVQDWQEGEREPPPRASRRKSGRDADARHLATSLFASAQRRGRPRDEAAETARGTEDSLGEALDGVVRGGGLLEGQRLLSSHWKSRWAAREGDRGTGEPGRSATGETACGPTDERTGW